MGVSLYRIAEECRLVLGDRVSSVQALIPSVIEAYAYVAKKAWFEQTSFDEMQIDGSLINVFENQIPKYDKGRDIYYLTIPSTYLMLPHQMGINWVGTMKDKESWILVKNWGMFSGLKASLMGGRKVYQIEGNKMLFPKMTDQDCEYPLILKLAIAYDTISPYEQINIAPNLIVDIKNIVTAPLLSKEDPISKIREIIN
jgi:hypothetical protein